jgi:hypothetical protein
MWPRLVPFETLVEDVEALATAVLPAMKPASAAPIMSDFIDFVIAAILLYLILDSPEIQALTVALCRLRAKHSVGFPVIMESFSLEGPPLSR